MISLFFLFYRVSKIFYWSKIYLYTYWRYKRRFPLENIRGIFLKCFSKLISLSYLFISYDQVCKRRKLIASSNSWSPAASFFPIGTHNLCKKNIWFLCFKRMIKSCENCVLRLTNLNYILSSMSAKKMEGDGSFP